jgi:hypothetical protein
VRWIIVCAALLNAQDIKPDTQALAAKLVSVRSYKVLPAANFLEIQNAAISWIDTRLRAGVPVEAMNAELRLGGLFQAERKETDDVSVSFIGYLSPVSSEPMPGDKDLLAVRFGVGVMCGYDETALIYHRQPLRLIGRLDHHDTGQQAGQGFSQIRAVGGIIASGTFTEVCNTTYMGINLRIDRVEDGKLRTLLSQPKPARFLDERANVIKISVSGNVVTFLYTASMFDGEYMARPAIARYLVSGNAATRIAPIALSRMGFVDEWARLDTADVAKYAPPEAIRASVDATALFEKASFGFDAIRDCGNSAWEIVLSPAFDHKESAPRFYVLISGSTASELRIVRAGRQPQSGCVAASHDLLSAPLPQ